MPTEFAAGFVARVMGGTRRFLIVEDDSDGEFLLRRSLLKAFPDAAISTFHDGDAAFAAALSEQWDAHVVHRALDIEGLDVVAQLRRKHATRPIIMVSSRHQPTEALSAGATHFIHYHDWQNLGRILAETLARSEPDATTAGA